MKMKLITFAILFVIQIFGSYSQPLQPDFPHGLKFPPQDQLRPEPNLAPKMVQPFPVSPVRRQMNEIHPAKVQSVPLRRQENVLERYKNMQLPLGK